MVVLRFDEIAWNFPRLKFSMEHVGGYHFFHEALAVIFNHVPPPWETGVCNVFAGLASVFTQERNRFWYLSDERLKELAAQVGVRQLIFGLDFPYNTEPETMKGLETIRSLFTPAEQEQILGGNLRRELGVA
jgi:predicted TIM-barrel fold metal-dependent hydrolase